MIVHTFSQKNWLIKKGYPACTIDVVRYEDMETYLRKRLDRMPMIPREVQLEFYFGEEFNWWWYDKDGSLHPKPEPEPEFPDYEDDIWDDDIPF